MTSQKDVSDEMLMALADGELPEAEARALETRVAADPGLAARLAVFAETRAMLSAAFPPDPVPQRLIDAVLAMPDDRKVTASVLPFAPRKVALPAGWIAALAACLVLAVGTAGFVVGRGMGPGYPPVTAQTAAKALAALPTGSEVVLGDGSTARALASFQTDLGLCRLIGTETTRAVVCRATGDTPEGWAVALSVTASEDEAYLPASDLGTALIDQLLTDIGASAPLDPAAEAQALTP